MRTTTIATSLFALVCASTAFAGARDDCAGSGGTWLNKRCFCPDLTKLDGGKCVPQICRDERPKAPPSGKTGRRSRRVRKPVEPKMATCRLDKAGTVMANLPGEPVIITVDCDAGTGVIGNVTASCEHDCQLDGGATKENRVQKKSRKPVPVHEVFTVKPAGDPKAETPAVVSFQADAPDGSSTPVSVTVKWPVPPPPPPPPVAKKSQTEIDCERDGDGFMKDGKCICLPPKIPGYEFDKDGNTHLCVNPPPPQKGLDGHDGHDGVTTIVYKGDASHFTLAALGTGLMIEKDFATGIGLTAGGSISFGAKGKWRLNFAGGAMYAPTPEYQDDGVMTRAANGGVVKNSWGFLASGGVSYLPRPEFELGLGVGYWRLGQHWSGTNSGKGTIEAIGAVVDLIWYFHRAVDYSLGVALRPMVGAMYGGKSSDTRATSGGSLELRLLL